MTYQAPIVAALAALCAALVALLIYHAAFAAPAFRRLRELLALHDAAIGGDAGGAGKRILRSEQHLAEVAAAQAGVNRRLGELDALARTDISRIGFVRYDAFDDTGSELSYALALLSRDGNGVVLTSIYSRSDTRTFGKAVAAFTPLVNASEEELRAIASARDGIAGS